MVWYNVTDWAKISRSALYKHYLLCGSVWLLWGLVGLELTRVKITSENFVQVCGGVALVLGGSITSMRIVENWRHRTRLTLVLNTIDQKIQLGRSVATGEMSQRSNFLFLLISWAGIVGLTMIIVFSIGMFSYATVTGELYFKMALPFNRAPYSIVWWCELVFSTLVVAFCGIIYNLMECMLIDIVMQICFLFGVEYDKLRSLSHTDCTSHRKMAAVAVELESLKRCVLINDPSL